MRNIHIFVITLSITFCSFHTIKAETQVNDLSYSHSNHEVPEAMHQQIDSVLNEHKDDILLTDDVNKIDLSDIKPGTVYKYKSTSVLGYVYKFNSIQSGHYYFDLEASFGGSIGTGYSIYRTNGYIDEIASLDKPDSFSKFPSNVNNCKFKIGTCEYTAGK